MLGGFECVPDNNHKDFSCPKVVLHQPEYAGPCVQGGSKLYATENKITSTLAAHCDAVASIEMSASFTEELVLT